MNRKIFETNYAFGHLEILNMTIAKESSFHAHSFSKMPPFVMNLANVKFQNALISLMDYCQ